MDQWIKLSLPHLNGLENEFAAEAINSTWITPLGPFVDQFENRLAAYLGVENVVALSSGTAAIHLALAALGVGKGDEVICQSMTFAASANPVAYLGASPVFVDSETSTWNISPALLEKAIVDRVEATGRKPKAIVAVHLYGMPAMFDEINAVATRYGIPVVEDAAEAIGSRYKGRRCATLGRFGALSFNGNKMITTSGGGALVCPDKQSADRVKFLATQARENRPYYYHETIGYNYRLSNVSAAIGCAQMETLRERVDRRRAIHAIYRDVFADCPLVKVHDNPAPDFDSNFWLSTIIVDEKAKLSPDDLRRLLADRLIETRLLWRPMTMQPVFAHCEAFIDGASQKLFDRGLCLPSSTTLDDDQIVKVAETIKNLLK